MIKRISILCLALIGISKILIADDSGTQKLDLNLDITNPDIEDSVDEVLNRKLKKYEAPRINRSYDDKYGMSIARDLGSDKKIESTNPSLNEQINKAESFKKIYEGPKDDKAPEQLGFKLSVPLNRD